MAAIIPSLSSHARPNQKGERRFAERLEKKLDNDYLIWHDVPIGTSMLHPDFVIVHPGRGILILEVKDWHLSTILQVDRKEWRILEHGESKMTLNPLEQARNNAHTVIDALQRDAQLVHPAGHPYEKKLAFPWAYGVVFTEITRKQFTDSQLDQVIEPYHVICKDEMTESVDAEAFQERLWLMFKYRFLDKLTLPQIDRIRWILYPEVRVMHQQELLTEEVDLPDIMRVMDIQQEQFARSLGEGHRVIHGVAGSGKTMILAYRAEYLAKVATKPILILCFSEPLAKRLQHVMETKGIADKVAARHFHGWCYDQLTTYHQAKPTTQGDAFYDELVQRVIDGVERKHIPAAQYEAVLIDEGHDFAPAWYKLIVQMVSPESNHVLVLYDDAQSIFKRAHHGNFSFRSVGIQAQGRTNILRINYRNTRQILELAALIAKDILDPKAADDDGVPLIKPAGCGREGPPPFLIKLPSLREETYEIAKRLDEAHRSGLAWGDMAIVYRRRHVGEQCVKALERADIPYQWHQRDRKTFSMKMNAVSLFTMHASKGLEFPLVAIPGIGMLSNDERQAEQEARLLYIAATRSTHQLIITGSGNSVFMDKIFKTNISCSP